MDTPVSPNTAHHMDAYPIRPNAMIRILTAIANTTFCHATRNVALDKSRSDGSQGRTHEYNICRFDSRISTATHRATYISTSKHWCIVDAVAYEHSWTIFRANILYNRQFILWQQLSTNRTYLLEAILSTHHPVPALLLSYLQFLFCHL